MNATVTVASSEGGRAGAPDGSVDPPWPRGGLRRRCHHGRGREERADPAAVELKQTLRRRGRRRGGGERDGPKKRRREEKEKNMMGGSQSVVVSIE